MKIINHSIRMIAVALVLVATNAFAADYYLKIEGIKGERARIVRCPDAACAIDNLPAGNFTVSVCDSKGNPVSTNNFSLTMNFTAVTFRESPSKSLSTATRESPTRASTGVTTVSTSEVVAPRDVATGQSSGKRQHGTVKITKEWNASTPKLALMTPSDDENGEVSVWKLEIRVEKIEMK